MSSPAANKIRDIDAEFLAMTMQKRQLTIDDIMHLESDSDSEDEVIASAKAEAEATGMDYGCGSCDCTNGAALHGSSLAIEGALVEGGPSAAIAPIAPETDGHAKQTLKGVKSADEVDVNNHALQHYFATRHPHRHCSVTELLDYNRKWANYMNENDPMYFKELAKHQAPKFLWIGCADSRVPANEILGLAPGDVFVHRNVANVVYPSDLNCLACVQFGVEQLKIEHLIISGHYECGGVKASYYDLQLGLVDNWVASIRDIKHRYWKLIEQVPEDQRVATLCEINAIVQARHVADTTVVQRWWATYRDEQGLKTDFGTGKCAEGNDIIPSSPTTAAHHHNVTVHGWIYGLADGLIIPLVEIGPFDDAHEKCDTAIRQCVAKRVPTLVEEYKRRKSESKNASRASNGADLVDADV